MRAIAVDDEELGLSRIMRLLKKIEYLSYVNGYNNPKEAIENACIDNADIAFLDIEMPEINGLVLAEMLMEKNPKIEVIFITAYDKYALQAFEVNAIGYLLKPVELGSIKQKLERVLLRQGDIKVVEETKKLYIKVFKYFLVSDSKDMKNIIEFRTEKAKELLGILLSHQGKPITKDKIIYRLWPDMEMERAAKNFHTTCYYVRKVIKEAGINNFILRKEHGYSINMNYIDSDLNSFCSAIREIRKKEPQIGIIKAGFFEYGGSYFENEYYEWAYAERNYYGDYFENMGIYLSNYYEGIGQMDECEKILKYLFRVNPLSEKACSRLIKISMEKGDIINAKKIYKNFQKNVDDEMGEKTLKILEDIIEKY
ncbi:response regulator [Clostridium hydrogenum]|uniref:response regulator n=1 Tax=Clostridium hydrogenum TaxID=2855764 RepID=UPI001F25E729|nr:response regulator [Clostridium hydrogenum]